jgi:hypothetical protein
MTVFEEITKVQKLAAAEAAGDEKAHGELLKAIRALQLAAETPIETTSRLNFQVRVAECCYDGPLKTTLFISDGRFRS